MTTWTKKNKKQKSTMPLRIIVRLLFIGSLTAICFFFGSCKAKEVIVNHTEYVDRVKYDSIYTYKSDSVYIHQKGDTILIEKFKTLYRDKISIQHDSIFKTDSVVDVKYVDKIKVVEVKTRGLIWWSGLFSILAFVSFIVLKLVTWSPAKTLIKTLLKIK